MEYLINYYSNLDNAEKKKLDKELHGVIKKHKRSMKRSMKRSKKKRSMMLSERDFFNNRKFTFSDFSYKNQFQNYAPKIRTQTRRKQVKYNSQKDPNYVTVTELVNGRVKKRRIKVKNPNFNFFRQHY